MNYIDFSPLFVRIPGHWDRSKEMSDIRTWLETHAGDEKIMWEWNRGDLFARGVTIYDDGVAVLFRLRFSV